ncbi:MAG TPA: prolyl oligopeptidase family serine peptidase [Gemmatimonadaceae bacterium]|nr:prolyl oligopeptidase family serine peptidase [Gemmatimonadaceae bacterium]
MMLSHWLSSIAVSCVLAAALPGQRATGFLDRTVKVGALTLKYQVYVPPTYDGHTSLPVILFMHGSGERGSDGLKQTQVGMPSQIRWHRDWFNAIVVMPQCPDDSVFRGVVADATFAALEKSVKEFHGDRERLYATGLSMGGYGVWQQIVDHPGVFAAAVAVSGGLTPSADMDNLFVSVKGDDPFAAVAQVTKGLPIWIFHGAKDDVVPTVQSRKLVQAMRDVGTDVKYTEYPDVGHGAWDPAYADEELWKWLFAQRLVKPSR